VSAEIRGPRHVPARLPLNTSAGSTPTSCRLRQGRNIDRSDHHHAELCRIYSQLRSCSSSEVAAMIDGLLRHCSTMVVEGNYVDTHG
jgi:TnpA family transposase